MAAPAAENLEMRAALADLTKWLIQDRRTHAARLHGDSPPTNTSAQLWLPSANTVCAA